MRHGRDQASDRDGGFVLVAVLAVMALLSAMVVALLLSSRSAVDGASIGQTELESDAMVRSAVNIAAHQLFVLGLDAGAVDGQQIRLDQGVVTLAVASEAGKVDLNGSAKALLAAAFVAAGAGSMPPQIFAARVLDWRDDNDDISNDGAEAADYAAAGALQGPRNGPFRSVDDLRFVLGVSEADIAALRDFVTVYNPRGRLDAFAAPIRLVAAFPNVAPETLEGLSALRATRTEASIAGISDLLLVQSSLIDAEKPRSYRLGIDVQPRRAGKRRRVDVVIAAGVTPTSAFQVLHWREDPNSRLQ